MNGFYDPQYWVGTDYDEEKAEGAKNDLNLLRERTRALYHEEKDANHDAEAKECLRSVTTQMRYQIATNEPLSGAEPGDLSVTTLWGAKGVTAEHVYILGACEEALPGERRDEYPGTEAEYVEEQKRLFYVSITRAKETLVISRARRVRRGLAAQLGLSVSDGYFWIKLNMSPFLHEIMNVLPGPKIPGLHD